MEEGLEKDDQYEDSSVISDQSFHPEEDNIEVYDENQKKKIVTQDINESLEVPVRKHRRPEIVKADRTEIQEGSIKKNRELNKGKQAPCADTYLMKETNKERNMNWCEEYGLNKIILLNYTKRGKQLRNSRIETKLQLQQQLPKVLVPC